MSYRNPKYTYQSHASYYQNLINAGVKAGADIADQEKDIQDEKELNQKINSARVEAGRGANQAHVTTGVQSNTYGNEVTKGAIGNFFTGSGGIVGDLTMQTTGPDAPCNRTGNCAQLNARLATLKKAPEHIKEFTETMLAQVNYDDYENFDENQGGNFILAANVLGGKGRFTPAYGYSYDIEENQVEGENGEMTYDGSYNWVFKFDENKARKQIEADCEKMPTQDGCDDIDGLISKMKYEGDNFKINSAGLKQQTGGNPPGSVFVRTPNMTKEMADIVTAEGSSLISNAETDDNGKIIPGTGTFNINDFKRDDEQISEIAATQINEVDGVEVKTSMELIYNKIDKNKVKGAIANELVVKFNHYKDPRNQGEAVALWNKVLSPKDLTDINVEEVEKAIGFAPTEEDLKTWSYDDPNGLTDRQIALFEHLYEDYAADEVVKLMGNQLYKQQRLETNERTVKTKQASETELEEGV